MSNHIYVSKLEGNQFDNYIERIYKILNFLVIDYPKFESWYWDKVVQGIKNHTREIIVIDIKGEIAAVSILKKEENKICCLMVMHKYQKQGLGSELLEESMRYLQCIRPLITVSSRRINAYSSLFNKYGFQIYEKIENYYVDGIAEYVYNGTLKR